MTHVLCVGNATLDIVNLLESYPDEDSEIRALSQSVRMGGNAANTARVLAHLGNEVQWLGNLSDQPQAAIIELALQRCGVSYEHAKYLPGSLPTSYISLSQRNGSRSIVHHRDLAEYAAEDFAGLNLYGFDWVHFEGRAVDQLKVMMLRARNMCGLPLSLEVEKARPGIETLFGLADVLFFSHDYARTKGFFDAETFLLDLPVDTIASCTWGDGGAWVRDESGEVHHAIAFEPVRIVDTIGAGDVFNAAMVHGLTSGQGVVEALQAAVILAGEHCGHEGFV